MKTVWEFRYTDCIYESAMFAVSLHETKRGAEIAMEFHKESARKEFDEMYKDEKDIDWKYDTMCAWDVIEREILP